MANEQLKRFPDQTSRREIMNHVVDVDPISAELVEASADFGEFEQRFLSLKNDGTKPAEMDALLVEQVHTALKDIPASLKLDPRFWEYLAAERFRAFVWSRWWAGKPLPDAAAAQDEKPSKWRRFECRRTMNGMSRNALARLFWAGELLADGSDYSLARACFEKQDIHQQVFDQLFGLHDAAAKAFVRSCAGRKGEEIQKLGARLNEYCSTIAVDFLNDQEIETLLK